MRKFRNSRGIFGKYLRVKSKFEVTRVSFINSLQKLNYKGIAYRPNSKVLAQSGGKGISKEQTLISALMESYECHTAENVDYTLVDTYGNGKKMANPYKISTTLKDYRSVDPLRWCLAKNMFNNEDVYVPYSAVSLDFTVWRIYTNVSQ